MRKAPSPPGPGAPLRHRLLPGQALAAATHGFDEGRVVGEGGFGKACLAAPPRWHPL
jgi:hypothetical protein